MTDWQYEGRPATDEDTEGCVAFVYMITRLDTSRRYIGKKRLLKKQTKKPLKGKKRKRVSYSSSDWREYWGSNDTLKADIAELGEQNFKREVLVWCKTLSGASYIEAKYQFEHDAILSEDFYNEAVMVRVRTSPAFRADIAQTRK